MLAQRALGIESVNTRGGRDFEKHSSKLGLVKLRAQGANLGLVHEPVHRQLLLLDLLPDRLGVHQGREAGRLLLEDARQRRAVLLLGRLDLFPLGDDLAGSTELVMVSVDVGMPPDELLVDVAGNVVEIEVPALLRDQRMKDDLDQHVSQLLPHVRQVLPVDGVEQLAAFVDQAARKRLMGLLPVPGAFEAQTGHGGPEFVDGGAHPAFSKRETPEIHQKSRVIFSFLSMGSCVSWSGMDKLTEIMAHKRLEVAPRAREVPLEELANLDLKLPRVPSFAEALRRTDGTLAVIAEIKRRSPSAGAIREGIAAADQAIRYHAAGADALSVLTDEKYFGGQLSDLQEVTSYFSAHAPARPCLRKDFMVHPIQVLEARQSGASAILIIVRALDDDEILRLHTAASAAGLDALFEIHNEAELDRAIRHDARIIGVNNRDLAIFKTDLGLSERLIPLIPPRITAVSESGIFSAAEAARARAAGAHAVLVGEALMKTLDPAGLLSSFRSA